MIPGLFGAIASLSYRTGMPHPFEVLRLDHSPLLRYKHQATFHPFAIRRIDCARVSNKGKIDDFMFELTREEIRNISQSVICSSAMKHAKNVHAFTEQGVA
jgi:hypothetical protein